MDDYGYGLWILVAINSAIFIIFALSFFKPKSARDWRAMGAFSAFVVALFTEMYGFPLTIYLLSGWFGSRFPELTLTHGGGFWLISAAWRVLWQAQRDGHLAVTGPYARIRHPQYAGFLLIMIGFLAQWPTIPTLLMFPVLVLAYRRLAIGEEREVRAAYGPEWDAYAAQTPRFITKVARLTVALSQR